jgi:hypothetical protein
MRRRSISPFIPNLGARWRRVVKFTLRLTYHPPPPSGEEIQVPIIQEGGLVSERAGLLRKRKFSFSSLYLKSRDKTLYVLHGLRYPTTPPPPKKKNKTKYRHINLQVNSLGLCQFDIYIYMCVCVCVYECMSVCVCVCVYECMSMCVCMSV